MEEIFILPYVEITCSGSDPEGTRATVCVRTVLDAYGAGTETFYPIILAGWDISGLSQDPTAPCPYPSMKMSEWEAHVKGARAGGAHHVYYWSNWGSTSELSAGTVFYKAEHGLLTDAEIRSFEMRMDLRNGTKFEARLLRDKPALMNFLESRAREELDVINEIFGS